MSRELESITFATVCDVATSRQPGAAWTCSPDVNMPRLKPYSDMMAIST